MRIPVAEYNRLKLAERNLAAALSAKAEAELQLANLATVRTPTNTTDITSHTDNPPKKSPGPVYPGGTALSPEPDDEPSLTSPTDEVDEDGFPLVRPSTKRRQQTPAQAQRKEPNVTLTIGGPPPPATHVARATGEVLKNAIAYGQMYQLAIENTATAAQATNDPNRLLLPTITPSQVQIALEALEMGMNRKTAFAMAGITSHNYDTIVRRARQQQEPYLTLASLIEIAEARCEAQLTHNWQLHTAENWQAAQALLVKRFADTWGDKRPVSLNVKDLLALPPEKLREILGDEIADTIDAEFTVGDDDD